MSNINRRDFIKNSATLAAIGSSITLASCGSANSTLVPAQFLYGVASGDPLSNAVILWTHAKPLNIEADVNLTYQVATDAAFTNVVTSGSVIALSSAGNTAKVDATGLTAGTSYFYRFTDANGSVSPVGTTKTLPATSATSSSDCFTTRTAGT
jgi:alkaline phosphatase D